jgi:hypothetical protein
LIVALLSLVAIGISKVSKGMNLAGVLASTAQLIFFCGLFVGGNWVTGKYVIGRGESNVGANRWNSERES